MNCKTITERVFIVQLKKNIEINFLGLPTKKTGIC